MKKLLSLVLTGVTLSIASPVLAGAEVYIDEGDISPWADDAVTILTNAGCMIGYPDGTFRPQEDITREELAVTLQACLESLAVYLEAADAVQYEEIAILKSKIAYLETKLASVAADTALTKEDLVKARDHYVTLGAGFASDDMSAAIVAIEAKLEIIEFGIFSLSARPGINTMYEVYSALTLDADITDKLEAYAGVGGAIRVTDTASGALTQGLGDGELAAYAQGGLALDLSNKTVITLDAKVPLNEANDRGVVVTAGIGLKF